jgi:DNA-binding transcriptional MocR family regulator
LPQVGRGEEPLYLRIADAIEKDIADRRLPPGIRLPPHRDLATSMAISTGTIAKAYREAERRGLLQSHVGRGSFVSHGGTLPPEPRPQQPGTIGLARNIPPTGFLDHHLAEALRKMVRRPDLAGAIGDSGPEGLEQSRWAGAEWIRQRHGIPGISAANLVQCNGSLNALSLILGALARAGDTLLCEAATFHGVKMLAEELRLKLRGIAVDSDGLLPEALDEAAEATNARLLYVIPTLQNPTTATLSEARREEIGAIARRRNLVIVEDDTYRVFADTVRRPATVQEMVPERTFHVATLSKILTPGLRLSYVVSPLGALRDAFLSRVVASGFAPPPLSGFLFSQWLEDGTAETVADQTRGEIVERTELALRILGPAVQSFAESGSPHIWLPLTILDAERTAGRALRAGVQVTPPDAPVVAGDLVSGLRLCLGAADSRATLEKALKIVRRAITGEVDDRSRSLV